LSDCCPPPKSEHAHCDSNAKRKPDIILWGSLGIIVVSLIAFFSGRLDTPWLMIFSHSITELLGKMWWGLALGIFFVSILGQIPQKFVIKILGKSGTVSGILRAALAGILLDLCSHGILLVGAQLYKKGAGLGQVMAFLIASPWNSLSLTLILWALIGFWWMLTFLLLSFVTAIISGIIFDVLVKKQILPANENAQEIPKDFRFWAEIKVGLKTVKINRAFIQNMLKEGVSGSRMILKWIFFGVVLASLIRTFVPTEYFTQFFGPTLAGLLLTVVAATVIEVCSEGSTPIAADLLTRAGAPGNSFTFLMTGVSTDYTEIMVLKETTGRWKIALFLPLVTVPQIILFGLILNSFN
jgi:uncharacterized membrane protein YraQ (UPF0718 family)